MEATPGDLAAERNGVVSLPQTMPLSSSRKEWRIVSEQRSSVNEELERTKSGQSDERLIYEVQNGREPLDVDFCSLTIDGGLGNDILQQRFHNVAKQREELQNVEIEIRAQVIARTEIMGLQNRFDAQIKERTNATLKLQEQLHEKEQKIHELERRMNEKERELHAIRLDNEAAWAKEDLLREQSKELQSYRREMDNSEAERAQHTKQIQDLQEHIQEKERQFIELQEQHRIAQETIIFKDDQLREAQVWITRAQEMDAFQSTNIHTLQAELRDRTEQYNQLWLVYQRQFGEMEKLHLHLQQLQLGTADTKEKNGSNSDGLQVSHTSSNDASRSGHVSHSQLEVSDNSPSANVGSIQYDNTETSGENTLTQTNQVPGVVFAPSPFGMPAYLPTALHPFVMHPQGVPHPSHVAQSHFHSLPAMSSIQNWQGQQAGDHMPTHAQYPEQTETNLLGYEESVNGQVVHEIYLNSEAGPGLDADYVVPSPNEEGRKQVHNPINESHDISQPQQNLQQISSEFDAAAVKLDFLEHGTGTKEEKGNAFIDHGLENEITLKEHSNYATSASSSEASIDAVNLSETESTTVSTGQKSVIIDEPEKSYLLDERALLASIARTIGSGGRIMISSTLSNRLGRMIAPLHWHDYEKKYGKLEDFVASHPDLFLIGGNYIHLREGAQEIIAATAAVAKVAAIGPSPYTFLMPSVALTPMAHSHRLKKVSSLEASSAKHVSNVRILSKPKDQFELNGPETRPGLSLLPVIENGTNSNGNDFSHSKGVSRGRPVGKQQRRDNEYCINSTKIDIYCRNHEQVS
ncbi:hypothetical protein OROGR_022534 [Orobanche gracilis]